MVPEDEVTLDMLGLQKQKKGFHLLYCNTALTFVAAQIYGGSKYHDFFLQKAHKKSQYYHWLQLPIDI